MAKKNRATGTEGGEFVNPETGEVSLPGESQEDFEARTLKNGPEPVNPKGHTPVVREPKADAE